MLVVKIVVLVGSTYARRGRHHGDLHNVDGRPPRWVVKIVVLVGGTYARRGGITAIFTTSGDGFQPCEPAAGGYS